MYDEAEGSTRDEKINSMRRMQYKDPETRARINAQKRAAYAERNKRYGLAAGAGSRGPIADHDLPIKLDVLVDGADRRELLLKYEKMIADEPIENAIVITRDGEVYRCFGTKDGVYPDVDLGEKLIGADVTHNHPIGSGNEYSFSKLDLGLFDTYGLNSLRGIDDIFEYEINRNSSVIDELESVFDLDDKSARHSEVIDYARKHNLGYTRKRR
ncbi:MAG: hypothetical protein J5518_08490 [Lachnospiraceae bacterium]|nr:hypothetical protein [Lachnospiraceae bacterium]